MINHLKNFKRILITTEEKKPLFLDGYLNNNVNKNYKFLYAQ
jgi:hypothetical protein